ncbi:hypothetical protein Barb4_00134 [Bacteroidales bacterium Barb4]|nr:hypothetical protein Barb4_00134 [Bacteroidales bacterium Barb4]
MLHVGLKSGVLAGQGYRNDPVRGILKGYRISAPHGAERNVGLMGWQRQGSSERTPEYVLHCEPSFAIYIVLAGLHRVALSVTPHSAALHVGLKSGVLAGLHCQVLSL